MSKLSSNDKAKALHFHASKHVIDMILAPIDDLGAFSRSYHELLVKY